jgi:hypothetical protein
MKTKNILLILFVLISFDAFSQLKVGLRVGITSSTIKADDFTAGNYKVETLSGSKVGLQGGLMARLTIVKFFIQPEALISTSGGDVRISDISNGTSKISKQKFTKLDVPVMVGTKLGPLRLQVGPVASIVLNNAREAIDFSSTSMENKYHKATFGYQAGLGLDIKKLAIDLKYEGNLTSIGNGVKIGGENYTFDSRNKQWILGIGIFF